jgi:hypothetical protein
MASTERVERTPSEVCGPPIKEAALPSSIFLRPGS